jgi:amidohydrolase
MDVSGGRKMKRKVGFVALSLCLLVFAPGLSSGEKMSTDKRVEEIVSRLEPSLIEIRRDIHCHPEYSTQEKRTSALVADYFRKLGLEVKTGIAGTGVLGILRGAHPGPVVGMRGDMDALPITEETGLPFASKEKMFLDGWEVGLMHACGHDLHTTMLLGVAHVLSELKSNLKGTVLFVAQPAEETIGGAEAMLKAGLFQQIKPEAMFAFHVEDSIKAGYIKYTFGEATANVDGFDLTIESTGCHGSSPWLCVDPIVVGAEVVTALQVMVAREIDVNRNTVVTVGSFHAGTARNVIPQQAELKATVRTYGEDQRQAVKEKIERLVKNLCEAAGAPYRFNYDIGTPSVYNDPRLLQKTLLTAERVLGGKSFVVETPPDMGGEDFSYFSRQVPSVLLWLGVVPADVKSTALHSPTFVADEKSIAIGVRLMSAVILDYLVAKK